ncbi:MAG: trypsin-like peptidase domain-containing protein [Lachnospiraceae bacterium]|nr:trypsin-like peptidase domain-containing protein [Lachnospiraceae bacterium]
MEENNKNENNSYTGEYGNPVEGASRPGSSIYSYSYKDGDNSVTHSGDYYPGQDGVTGGTPQNEGQDIVYPQQAEDRQQPVYNSSSSYNSYGSSSQDSSYNNYSSNINSNGSSQEKKGMGTGKKMFITVACAVVFGVVAGACFEAVHYVSDNVLGITAQNTKKIGTTTDSGKTTTSKTANNSSVSVKGAVTDVSGIVEQTMPAIVAITSTTEGANYYDLFGQYYQQRDKTSCGSGFIVGQNDNELFIATNNHVIDNAKTISVQFIDDEVYEAAVKGTAASNDLAVIAVKTSSVKPATMDKIKIADLGSSDSLKVGEMAVAIGNSLGYGQSVTVGYISAKDREITEDSNSTGVVNKIKAIQTDAAINPGNSGGALLNLKGQVIGINSAKIADSSVEGVGYAIPISVATPIIDELMNKEELTESEKGYLGVSVKTVTDEASYYNIPNGVYVEAVSEGGAADKAGLKAGDIITCINNMEVTTKESLQEKVNSYRKGTEIEVVFQRSNNGTYEENKIKVKLQGQESLENLPDDNSSVYTGRNGDGQDDNQGGNGFGGFFSNPFSN